MVSIEHHAWYLRIDFRKYYGVVLFLIHARRVAFQNERPGPPQERLEANGHARGRMSHNLDFVFK